MRLEKKGKLHDLRPKTGARRMRKGLKQHDLQSQRGFHEQNNPEKAKRRKADQKRKGGESMYFCFESHVITWRWFLT